MYWCIIIIHEGSEAPPEVPNIQFLAKQSVLIHNNVARGSRGPPEAPGGNFLKTVFSAQHAFIKPLYLCVSRGIVLMYLDC